MSTLSRGDEIEADFYQLKAQEWACSRDEAKLRVAAALYPHRPNFTPFWQPPLGEKLLGITNYQDMVVVATDRMVYLIHEQGQSFDHTVIAAIAQKE